MLRPALLLALALAVGCLGIVGLRSRSAPERGWDQRLLELRALARTSEVSVSSGAASDELRARLGELDRRLQELAPPADAPLPHGLHEASFDDLAAYRAWVERARPALDAWLATRPCATPAGGGAERWEELPLRELVAARLEGDERIAQDMPRPLTLRHWGHLLAWHAWFESSAPSAENEPWELDPAGVLASIFPLVLACDDMSFIGTIVRIDVEQQALRDARTMLARRALAARPLRAALEPWLERSAAFQPRSVLAGELCAFLRLYERHCADEDGSYAALREEFVGVEEAFELARLSPPDLARSLAEVSAEPQEPWMKTSILVLSALHRHRTITALARTALAVAEHRERTGALPATLEELAPAFPDGLPLDPTTGAPFLYEVDGIHARLGPAACPEHALGAEVRSRWSEAVAQMLAWELE